jgi:hypothetical protein
LRITAPSPRQSVYQQSDVPLYRLPRAMREKVEILERGGQMVLAAHRTVVGPV